MLNILNLLYRNPEYFAKIKLPIDFATIEKNIVTGHYKSVDTFEDDFLRLFENAEVSPIITENVIKWSLMTNLCQKYHLCLQLINE